VTSLDPATSEVDRLLFEQVGVIGDYTFPRSCEGPFAPLADAHEALRAAARASLAWLDTDHLGDDGIVRLGGDRPGAVADWLLTIGEAQMDGAVVLDDGTDLDASIAGPSETVHRPAPMTARVEMVQALGGEGGFAVRNAQRLSPSLRRLHFEETAALHAQDDVCYTVGSVATRKLLRPGTRTWVCVLEGSGVARSASLPPTQLEAGDVITSDDPVRITGGAATVCLVIATYTPQPYDERKYLLRRATCHPLLRLDAALHLSDHQDLYGVGDELPFVDRIAAELDTLAATSTRDGMDAWWASRLLAGMPPTIIRGDLTGFRSWIPGGFGVVEQGEDQAVLAAGRRLFVVHRDLVETVARFAGPDPVPVDADPHVALVGQVLIHQSLAEGLTGGAGASPAD
jgi:hypothetical protein